MESLLSCFDAAHVDAHQLARLANPRKTQARDRTDDDARPVREGPQPVRGALARGRRCVRRLQQAPDHRRDARPPARAREAGGRGGLAREDVHGPEDQHHGGPRGPARRAAQPQQQAHPRRRQGRDARGQRGARQDARLHRPPARWPLEGPHRQDHHRCRQHRHRRLGSPGRSWRPRRCGRTGNPG